MKTYRLYRSGVLDVLFKLDTDRITYQVYDVIHGEWKDRIDLTDEKGEELEDFYHINPKEVFGRWSEYRALSQTPECEISTSWGAIYQQDEEHPHLWVEREKKYPTDVVIADHEPVAFIGASRENCSVLVEEGYEACTPVQQWMEGNISPVKYGVNHLGTFRVAMRDEIHLATEVWVPEGHQDPAPTILVRTPYGRMSYAQTYNHFIQRGYAVVVQDTRGRQDSEGEWRPMVAEMEDGNDTLNWIANQSWCDGHIGMIGASYGGFVQWAAAANGNPHLKALVSIVTAGSPFRDIPRKGGALVSGMLAWTFAVSEKEFKPQNMMRSDWDDVVNMRPLKDIPKRALGHEVPFWDEWMAHPVNDAFWQTMDWSRYRGNMKAPALIVSGWYDDNGMGTTEACEIVSHYRDEDKKIILGPWMHNGNTTRDIQGVPFGNNAIRYDLDYHFQMWMDQKLKHMDTGINHKPSVEYYMTGENQWKTARQWPPEQVAWTKMYLSGQVEPKEGNGALQFSPDIQEGYDTFTYDPENPAPHLIDISENEIGVPADYHDVEQRKDMLVYGTAPLAAPLAIAGDFEVKLFASSSAKDTDWVVRLTDVDPEGHSIKLADGVLRARYRKGFDQEVLLEPGSVEEYVIRTSKIACTLKKGHRLRLAVTSSADSFIFPNPNTGGDTATDVETVKAKQCVYYQSGSLSYIEVPVLEGNCDSE